MNTKHLRQLWSFWVKENLTSLSIGESIDIHDSQLLEYYAIAECYQGNLEKSKEIFLKAINLDPHNTNLLYNYSEILSDLGSHASTKEVLAKILSLEPEHNAARTKLEKLNLYTQDQLQKSVSDISVENLDRSINPLKAAFDTHEIIESKKYSGKRAANKTSKNSLTPKTTIIRQRSSS